MEQEECKTLLETLYVAIEQRKCFTDKPTVFVANMLKTEQCSQFMPRDTAIQLERLRQDYQYAITPECIRNLEQLNKREERLVVQTIAHYFSETKQCLYSTLDNKQRFKLFQNNMSKRLHSIVH